MYDDWLANGKHEYTAAGNMKPVPRRLAVEWIIKLLEDILNETVATSMKSCALALAVDGTEDGLISCFKEGQIEEERYWKVKCGCSPIINFTKILLKFLQKIWLTQHHFLT